MAWRRKTNILSFIGSPLLLCVLSVQVAFALAMVLGLHALVPKAWLSPAVAGLLATTAGLLILIAMWTVVAGLRAHWDERDRSRAVSNLMETVLGSSQEWLWAIDSQENITFSSRASAALLGYEPSDLIGEPVTTIMDSDDLASATKAVKDALSEDGTSWTRVSVCYRHRNGAPVWMEVTGRVRPTRDKLRPSFEGASRPLPAPTAQALHQERLRARIDSMVRDGMILTAFQPIYELATGTISGVEALARFPGDDGRSPDHWFNEAASVGLASKLEFATLEAALRKTAILPSHLYIALNLSPDTCLDSRLPRLLQQSDLTPDRIILELTEKLAVEEYPPLLAALEPMRKCGLRIAVDDAGSGFSSMRHILHLCPDIIKLDRSLIAGLDSDRGQQALSAAMVEFAHQIDAQIVAEGIETSAELEEATRLGITLGQGYLLGRPTLDPSDWAAWQRSNPSSSKTP
ncbi:EAL domain-containing protein [uncultured Arthrobacter sp.]|uniref:sensor domain-containing phosphodiesterase n=1 Tax=uncultured Arthrobacter sp. TaxID=114050 RepID=UPI0028D7E0CB|nr:EAL domain-containing protein [uncultured Arthrobacter sp.]